MNSSTSDDTHPTPPGLHQVRLTLGATAGESIELYPGQRLGAFELVRLLGKGGMGQVFLAEQLYPVQRQVALKFMQRRITDVNALARFEIERQALARMSHPAIAQVYEAGTSTDGFPYLAMEYVPGEPIDRCCERLRLNLRGRVELYVRVCLGVQHAHRRGILHLDLKPGNVLVAEVDGTPQPKIIDFGLATSATRVPGSRHSSAMAGTRGYMSPEQLGIRFDDGGTDVDARSDVYALGVMLYELICGAQPFGDSEFSANNTDALRRDFLNLAPQRLSERLRARGLRAEARLAAGDLEAIVARAMAVKRSERYESAGELIADLRAYLEYRPVRANHASRWRRVSLYVQRNPLPVAFAVALLLSLILGLTATTYGLLEARRERDIAAARQTEIERVATFQQRMLASADPATLGQTLQHTLAEQYASVDAVGRENFERQLVLANPTEAARQLLDRELLDRALTTIDRDLRDQPRVAVELMRSIAESYIALGRNDRALAIVTDARRRWQAIGGESGMAFRLTFLGLSLRKQMGQSDGLAIEIDALHAAASAAGDEGTALRAQLLRAELDGLERGKLNDSLAAVRDLLPRFDRQFGPDAEESLIAKQVLALLYSRLDDYEAALPLWEELIERIGRARGEDDLLRVGTLEQLAINHARRGELESALRLHWEVVAQRQRLQGNEHPATLNALNAVAVTLSFMRRYPEAIEIGRKVLDLRARSLGPDHPASLRSSLNLGAFYAQIDNIDEAAKLTRDSLQRRLRVFGEEHPDTYTAMQNLADYELILGNADEALRLAELTLSGRQRILGQEHPEARRSVPLLARALANAGRCESAIPLLEAEREAGSGEDSSLLAQSMAAYYLALCYRRIGRSPEADALVQDALRVLADADRAELNPPQRHALRSIRAGRL